MGNEPTTSMKKISRIYNEAISSILSVSSQCGMGSFCTSHRAVTKLITMSTQKMTSMKTSKTRTMANNEKSCLCLSKRH